MWGVGGGGVRVCSCYGLYWPYSLVPVFFYGLVRLVNMVLFLSFLFFPPSFITIFLSGLVNFFFFFFFWGGGGGGGD